MLSPNAVNLIVEDKCSKIGEKRFQEKDVSCKTHTVGNIIFSKNFRLRSFSALTALFQKSCQLAQISLYSPLSSLVHLPLTFSGLVCILSLQGRQEQCPFTTRLRGLKLAEPEAAPPSKKNSAA